MADLELVVVPVDGPAQAVFTTRIGGVSNGPHAQMNLGAHVADDPDSVRANRGALCAHLGIDPARVQIGTQVHGVHIGGTQDPVPEGGFLAPDSAWPDRDGIWSQSAGVAVGVFGADCLPVLLWRRDRPKVAAVHVGWKGLIGGILEAAVTILDAPGRTGVAIGPGIGPCCYAVGDELQDQFSRRFGDHVIAGRAVNLAAAAQSALRTVGIPEDAIWALETCTSCDVHRWFSYRRDGAPTGRQMGLIWPV